MASTLARPPSAPKSAYAVRFSPGSPANGCAISFRTPTRLIGELLDPEWLPLGPGHVEVAAQHGVALGVGLLAMGRGLFRDDELGVDALPAEPM